MIDANSLEEANKVARQDEGRANVQLVRLATKEDISWVEAMGGRVPSIASRPKLPSEWAKEGYFCLEGWKPKIGDHCDYYDREGRKRQGTVKAFDWETIVIDGERKITVEETFKVRSGR